MYKGWSNYETWNVHLWAEKDETYHHARLALLDKLDSPVTAGEVRAFFDDVMHATTPDFAKAETVGEGRTAINFEEIAEAWERDRQFRRGLL